MSEAQTVSEFKRALREGIRTRRPSENCQQEIASLGRDPQEVVLLLKLMRVLCRLRKTRGPDPVDEFGARPRQRPQADAVVFFDEQKEKYLKANFSENEAKTNAFIDTEQNFCTKVPTTKLHRLCLERNDYRIFPIVGRIKAHRVTTQNQIMRDEAARKQA